jgi:hypothetical protein
VIHRFAKLKATASVDSRRLSRRRRLVGAALITAAALPLAAAPAASGRPRFAVKSFSPTTSLRVSVTYRRIRGGRGVLVRLAANHLTIDDDGHGRVKVLLWGRRVRLVRVSRRRSALTRLRLRFRLASKGAVRARAGRSAKRRRLRLRPEYRVRVAANKRLPYRLGKVSIRPRRLLPSRPFSPNSFWNRPLPPDARLAPLSGTWVADLRQQMLNANPWINTTNYSAPVYTVGARQRKVRVKLDASDSRLQRAWNAVPLPSNARPAPGSDKHLVVWQPSTDTLWEFWALEKRAGSWHAGWGGRMRHVSTNPGYFTDPPYWGATATSLPLLGGLMRISELRTGRINHGLALAIPDTRAEWFTWPAQRTDGYIHSSTAIPEGTRFRLDPRLDLSKLHMDRIVRLVAQAAQRYGIVVRDKGGAVAFYAEDPGPTGSNPYAGSSGFFGGKYIDQLLREQFPWDRLQALKAHQRCCWKVG